MWTVSALGLLLPLLVVAVTAELKDDDFFAHWFNDQDQEIIDDKYACQVDGTIPKYITGSLIRMGPTKTQTAKRNFTNFLDGFGRVTSWTIDGATNEVFFQSAIIKSLLWNHSRNEKEEEGMADDVSLHICQEPTEPPMHFREGLDLNDMDNTDVNVYRFPDGGDTFLSFTDFYLANEIHLSSLRTLGSAPMGGNVPKTGFFSSSHPQEYTHPLTGATYLINWLGVKTARGSKIYVYAMGSDLQRYVLGEVEIDFLPYSIHSVALIGNYVAVVVPPVSIDFLKTGVNFCLSCSFKDKLDTDDTRIFFFSLENVGVVEPAVLPPVATAVYSAITNSSFFTYHHINSWASQEEQQQLLTLDMCAYYSMDGLLGKHVLGNKADMLNPSTRDGLPYACDAYKRVEVRLPVNDKKDVTMKNGRSTNVKIEVSNQDFQLVDVDGNTYRVELTLPNPLWRQRHHCFVYGVSNHALGSARYEDMAIVKVDVCAAEKAARGDKSAAPPSVVAVYHTEGVYVGEPIFVPASSGGMEDDGTLLVVTRHSATKSTRLTFLDARTLQEVASVLAPFPLMFEFHGQFFPSASTVAAATN